MMVTLQSTRFGEVEIDADSIIEFADGLIGLGGHRYALLSTQPDSPFVWLHSLEDPGLALPVTNPHLFFADFALVLDDDVAARLGIDADTHGRRLRHGAHRPRIRLTSPLICVLPSSFATVAVIRCSTRHRAASCAPRCSARTPRRPRPLSVSPARGSQEGEPLMLMITRRAGERVIVGGNIVITLVEVSGQTARIGIEAPKSMPIFREEIWVEVMRENEAAAQAADGRACPTSLRR